MRKTLLALLLAALLTAGCDEKTTSTDAPSTVVRVSPMMYIRVITVDSCEYLLFNGDKGGIIHKQNCKYCKMRANK